MLKYALIAVTMILADPCAAQETDVGQQKLKYAVLYVKKVGASMDTYLVHRGWPDGWSTLSECERAMDSPIRRFLCVPDRGAADDAMFATMKQLPPPEQPQPWEYDSRGKPWCVPDLDPPDCTNDPPIGH